MLLFYIKISQLETKTENRSHFFRISDDVDSKCEAIPVPMDISEDSGEKTPQPLDEKSPSEVGREPEKSGRLKVPAAITRLKYAKPYYHFEKVLLLHSCPVLHELLNINSYFFLCIILIFLLNIQKY